MTYPTQKQVIELIMYLDHVLLMIDDAGLQPECTFKDGSAHCQQADDGEPCQLCKARLLMDSSVTTWWKWAHD